MIKIGDDDHVFVLFWLFSEFLSYSPKRFIIIPHTNQADIQLLNRLLSQVRRRREIFEDESRIVSIYSF